MEEMSNKVAEATKNEVEALAKLNLVVREALLNEFE